MVTATIRLDLSSPATLERPEGTDRYALAALDHLPDGARVVVYIGSREWPTDDAARFLNRHLHRLTIELEAGPYAGVRQWLTAIRKGSVDL